MEERREYELLVVVDSITCIKTLVPRSPKDGYGVAWKNTGWYQVKAYDPLDSVSNQMGVTSVFFVVKAESCPKIGEKIFLRSTSAGIELTENPSNLYAASPGGITLVGDDSATEAEPKSFREREEEEYKE